MEIEATKTALDQTVRTVKLSKPEFVGGRDRIFVVPGTVHLGGAVAAKTIVWLNETGGPVKVWLAALKDILIPQAGQDFSGPIQIDERTNNRLEVTVKEGIENCQRDYHVFCEKIGNFADGNSPPNMSCP
jgi:hypothetical protein